MPIVETMKDLMLLIREEYNRQAETAEAVIIPAQLAAVVVRILDPRIVSPNGIRFAADCEIRELARKICRETFQEEEATSESGDLFEFRLQPRYPAERDGEDAYVPRNLLTVAERWTNIRRLENESMAKAAHAKALRAETEYLIGAGKLGETE